MDIIPFHKDSGSFGGLTPKASFMAGLATGVLSICSLGFIAMLIIFFFQIDISGLKKVAGNPTTNPITVPDTTEPTGSDPVGTVAPVTARDHVRGSNNAAVTLIEYSDFECPFCKRFHPTMLQLMEEYGDQVRWVYRHFPLSFHANAQKQGEASECVAELGGNEKFWEFTDKLYERTTSNGTGFALDKLPDLAAEIGVNKAKFEECLNSGKHAEYVKQDFQSGVTAGVTGTPGTIVTDGKGKTQLVPGAVDYAQLKATVDSVLGS
jgi:protein-disulfide isomerase